MNPKEKIFTPDEAKPIPKDPVIKKACKYGGSSYVILPKEWTGKTVRCTLINAISVSTTNGRVIEGPIINRAKMFGTSSAYIITPQQWRGCMIKCSLVDTEGLK